MDKPTSPGHMIRRLLQRFSHRRQSSNVCPFAQKKAGRLLESSIVARRRDQAFGGNVSFMIRR
jgi:hypothetical protein